MTIDEVSGSQALAFQPSTIVDQLAQNLVNRRHVSWTTSCVQSHSGLDAKSKVRIVS